MSILEVACFNLESALVAADSGASRIELCKDRASGGVTPDLEVLQDLKSRIDLPVFVMIRCRPGDFTCTEEEFNKMEEQISLYKPFADGFVFGILEGDGSINVRYCTSLVSLAQPLPCTFHRAFDQTGDLLSSLEVVISSGFKSILTSGGPYDAIHGQKQLAELVEKAKERINIIVGGGVRTSNIDLLIQTTRAKAYHTAAIVDGEVADKVEVQECRRRLTSA